MAAYEHRLRVLLEDTNLVGNVYFTRYVSWQERCRERFLAGVAPRLDGEPALIATRCACDYLAEAAAGDEVAVRMRTLRLARTLVTLAFEHWRVGPEAETLLARAEQRLACVRRERGRLVPAELPEPIARAFQGLG